MVRLPRFPIYLRVLWLGFLPLAGMCTIVTYALWYGHVLKAYAALHYLGYVGIAHLAMATLLTLSWFVRVWPKNRTGAPTDCP